MNPESKQRRLLFIPVLIVVLVGVCWHPSHLPAQVSDVEYDVYRAFLQQHADAQPVALEEQTDSGNVQLCPQLMKSDDTLLWELTRLQGKSFPLDRARLGAGTVPSGPHRLVKFTRVALAGQTGVLQVSTAECDKTCGPEHTEVFTTAKNGGAWTFRTRGCVSVRRPQVTR